MPDAIDQLCDLITNANARVYFDRGNDDTKHCTFCGTRPAPTHKLVRIGTYGNGDPLSRPVCDQCMPVAEAKASATESPVATTAADLTRKLEAATRLLKRIDGEIAAGVALLEAGEELPNYGRGWGDNARKRNDLLEAENQRLLARLSEQGERLERYPSEILLVSMLEGRCGGSPTIGHSRITLQQVIGMMRNGESASAMAFDFPGFPAEFWNVCAALAQELMPVPEEEDGG